jgi:hypothetical protein
VKLKSANAGRQAAFEQRKQQLDDWEKVHGPLPDAARQEFLFGIKNPTGTDTWKPEEIRLSDGSTVSALFDAKTAKWKYLNGGPIPDELLAGAKSAGSPESDYQKSLSDYRQKALALAQAKFDASKDPKNPQTKAALLRAQNDALKSEAYMIRAQAGAFGTYNGKALPGAMLDNEGNPVGSIFAPNVRPTSTQRERATLATSAKDQMKDMESILTDRNDLFGPVSGHGTNFTQWLGTPDPDAQRFKAAARVTADHLAGVFGGRSQYALESIYDVIGKNTTNPEAAIAALEQMMKAADIIQEQGIVNTVGGNPSSPKGKVTPKVPPPPRSGANPDTSKPKHSLAKAMALPFNKGKTEAQVRADLESHGYEVIP